MLYDVQYKRPVSAEGHNQYCSNKTSADNITVAVTVVTERGHSCSIRYTPETRNKIQSPPNMS